MKKLVGIGFLRCRVTNHRTNEEPKEENAILLGGGDHCGRVLMDGETESTLLNWGWIKFSPDLLKELQK